MTIEIDDLYPLAFLLDAFQSGAQQQGFMLVRSSNADRFSQEVKAEIGQAVLMAHWNYCAGPESTAARQRRLTQALKAGTDIAYADDILCGLASLGVVPRKMDAISDRDSEKAMVDIAYEDKTICTLARSWKFLSISFSKDDS